MKKAIKKFGIAILLLYFIGFFTVQPLIIYSTQSDFLRNETLIIKDKFYGLWLDKLDNQNVIKSLWIKNGLFWCNKFESCSVIEENK